MGLRVTDQELIRARIEESIAVKRSLLEGALVELVDRVAEVMTRALRAGNKILFCGTAAVRRTLCTSPPSWSADSSSSVRRCRRCR